MTSGIRSSLRTGMLVILALLFVSTAGAQEISKFDLEERAAHYFEQERYEKATADYEVLHDMYPKDAQYAYHLGRCYLHTNTQLDEASQLLKFAATRNYGDNAYFYLGRAYHLNYRFEDAALSYLTFQKTASGRDLKKYDVDYYLQQTTHAKQSVEVAQSLDVLNMLTVSDHALEKAITENLSGRYLYVPDEFKSDMDKETGYASLMFYSDDTKVGDYVYFSSKSKKGKYGTDIYRAQRTSESGYSLPEPLPSIVNTSYDEAYPYFDKLSSSLYFSSKGHNTSGGFDIYRTKYDAVAKSWSTPEKLAFPINSVHDDFLYTPTQTSGEVVFLTKRNAELAKSEAYTVSLNGRGGFVSPLDRDEVLTMALLSPESITINQPQPAQAVAMDVELAEAPELAIAAERTDDPYSILIEEAINYQTESDSLDYDAQQLRKKARDENNYQKKQELIASITTLDKEAKRLQRLADAKFGEAEKLRNPVPEENIAEVPDNLTPQSTPSGITLYTYNSSAPEPKTKPIAEPKAVEVKKEEPVAEKKEETYNKGYAAAQNVSAELASSFNIMNNSPYSKSNPIPVAAIPGGLVYRIQLGAYTQSIPQNTFGGLAPVSKEQAGRATKYYVGVFGSVKEAREALDEVKEYGYPDAFLVSFYNRSKISVQEAREIEFAR